MALQLRAYSVREERVGIQIVERPRLDTFKQRDRKAKKVYPCAVTVCIAAACQDKGEPIIVVCSDSRLLYGNLGSTNTAVKIDVLGHGWVVQMAGEWSAARVLCSVLKDKIQALPSVGLQQMTKASRDAIREFKRGPVYDPSDTSQLLVSGFEKNEACIVTASIFEGIERIELRDSFGTIGSGSDVANNLLSLRECRPDMPLPYVAYLVYEAKRSCEKLGSVGTITTMSVQFPNISDFRDRAYIKVMSNAGLAQLDVYYRGLWKVPLVNFPDFTQDFFDDLEGLRSHQSPKRDQ